MSARIQQALSMPMSLRRIALLLCALCGALPVQAESWYRIELLVFARHDASSGSEAWPDDPGAPDRSRARPLQPELDQRTPESPGAAPAPTGGEGQPAVPYQPLPRSQFQLQQVASTLGRAGGRFEPLLHLAWQQPVVAEQKAQWLYVRTPATVTPTDSTAPPRLEGLVRLSLGRYPHLNLDLLQHRLAPPGLSASGEAPAAAAPYRAYRLQAQRRTRSGEIHYFDHPLMGALVQITPVQTQSPAGTPPGQTATTPGTEEEAAPSEATEPAAGTPDEPAD